MVWIGCLCWVRNCSELKVWVWVRLGCMLIFFRVVSVLGISDSVELIVCSFLVCL